MPAVLPPSKVLVSGATGYIATWVVQTLLEKGYAVRGTARSSDKGYFLKRLFASYGSRFEVVIVEDISQDGTFDEVVKGVDAIVHTASPYHLRAVDPDELIKPAVSGTTGILRSILKDESNKVKRVVVTSSVASILHNDTIPITFTEADWNYQCLEILKKFEEEGRKNEAPNLEKYRASKTLAERSAWDFVNSVENKARISWDLVTLNPPLVFGPPIHEITTLASLNTSAATFHSYVADADKANAAGNEFLANTGGNWVDVRDLAVAHVLALEKEAAGPFTWQDLIDAANDVHPPPKLSTVLPIGVRGAGKTATHLILFDTTKGDRILGLRYRSMAEMTRDTLVYYEARGW